MNLARAFTTVGGATLLSRVLGFARDVLIAANLGTGPVADAFFVAFRLPNLFRRWFAEGAFNAAFVPLFSKHLEAGETGKEAARRFQAEALSGLTFILLIFTLAMIVAMPLIMLGYAPGFVEDAEKFALTVDLTRIAFPYLACMSVIALLSGVLNANGKFFVAAFAPVLLNLVLIAVLLLITLAGWAKTPAAGYAMAGGVALAGLVQLAMLWRAAAREGFAPRFVRPVYSPEMKRLVALGIPGVIAGGITQINIFVGTIIASLSAGAVSYLYYADRIYQLPLGVIGIAIGVVLLPDLSRRLSAGDTAAVEESQSRAIEYALLLTLPAAVALAVVPAPILSVLFERGAFTATDRAATAAALAAFALGLPAFVLIKVFSPGFFAREDTKTPMIFAAISVFVNISGSLALFPALGHVGIAIATSASGWVNAVLLGATLARRGHYTVPGPLLSRLLRMALASGLMGLGLYFAAPPLWPLLAPENPLLLRIALLGALMALAATLYFALAHLSGATDLRALAALFRPRPHGDSAKGAAPDA